MTIGNSVTIVVDVKNNSGPALAQTAAGAKGVGTAAEGAGRQIKDMGAKLDRLTADTKRAALATEDYRRAASHAASEAREQARAYDRLAANAREAARSIVALAAASKLGGGGGGRSGGGGSSFLSSLWGIPGDAAMAGKGAVGMAGAIGQGFASTPVLGPVAVGAAVIGGAAVAPLAGAAAGGAVALGGAAAGAGAGLAGAWMGDPVKFEGMWIASVDRVQKRWSASSAAFGDELTGALQVADRTLRDMPVEKILALSQSFVAPLAEGAGSGLTALADGFADSLEKAQPVVDETGRALANLGAAGGDAFRMISEGSEGGAHAIGDLAAAAGYAIRAVGLMILGFERAYEAIRDFEQANFEFIGNVPVLGQVLELVGESLFKIDSAGTSAGRALGDVGDSATSFARGLGEAATAGAEAELAALGLNDALSSTRSIMLGMADAHIAVAQGWIDLKKELSEGAKVLDDNSQAGIDNQKVIINQIGLLEQERQQAIKTGGGTAEAIEVANAAYSASIEKLRQAAYAAGLNKSQVDAMINSLASVPPNTQANVQVSGLSSALGQGISLGNALNRIDGRVFSARVIVSGIGDAARAAAIAGGAHAAGGPIGSGLAEVGEEGREYVRMPTGTMTYPHANTEQMDTMAGWRGGSGSGIEVSFGGDLTSAFATAFMKLVREGQITIRSSAIN